MNGMPVRFKFGKVQDVDLHLNIVKPLSATWMIKLFDYLLKLLEMDSVMLVLPFDMDKINVTVT